MKRDMELVRKILMVLAEHEGESFVGRLNIDGYNNEIVDYHISIMLDGGLLTGRSQRGDDRLLCNDIKISWLGNDLLEAIKNDTTWEKMKTFAKSKGLNISDIPVEMLKEIAISVVRSIIGS